jgi:hypothetical protein
MVLDTSAAARLADDLWQTSTTSRGPPQRAGLWLKTPMPTGNHLPTHSQFSFVVRSRCLYSYHTFDLSRAASMASIP